MKHCNLKTLGLIILLITGISLHSLQAEVIPWEEFQSLKLIYNSIENTDKATLLSGWDINRTDNDVTNWEGITVTDGHITAIDLSGKGLRADLYSLEGFSNDPSAFTPLGYERFCFLWMQKLKSLNLSNNNFYGSFPRLGFVRVGYPVESYMYDLEELIINDNKFILTLSIPKECTKLKTVNAENNRFMSFSVHGIPPLEKINFSNNMLFYQNFLISQWKKTDMPVLTVKELDISHNELNFGSLWWFSDPQGEYYGDIYDGFGNLVEEGKPDEYWNILYEPGVTVVYAPQDSVVMKSVNAKKVRSTVGDSFFVQLPDVGQRNDGLWYQYPEIIDNLDFQWYKDGVALEADIFPDLTREVVTAEDFGRYYCEIKSKSDRLKDLVLYTESFWVVNEENQPPALFIERGQQTERIKKGQLSSKVRLNVTDDVVWDGQSTIRDKGFEITQYPTHLRYTGDIFEIQVEDIEPMWTGRDSIEVSYCDYEGACSSIKLYYEVYDDLYSPDITQVSATANKKMTVEWAAGFYDTKIEKPDGYRLIIGVQEDGNGTFEPVKTIIVEEQDINSIEFNIPEREFEYQLQLRLYAYNEQGDAPYESYFMTTIPIIADSNLQIKTSSDSQIELEWTLASIMNMENHPYNLSALPQEYQDMFLSALINGVRCQINNNVIYRSIDEGSFEAIGMLTSANETFCLPVETTYTDNTIVPGHIYRYKLVKQAVSDTPFLKIELPYLESNIVELDLRNTAATPTILDNKIQLYPNPTKNQLVVVKENITINTIEIIDDSGKLQKCFNNLENEQDSISLDISQLNSGVYLVKIITPEETTTKKLIKQ